MFVPETPTSDHVVPESVVWYSEPSMSTHPSVGEVKMTLSMLLVPWVLCEFNDVTGCQDTPLSVLAYSPYGPLELG